jgi:hypothetical protein
VGLRGDHAQRRRANDPVDFTEEYLSSGSVKQDLKRWSGLADLMFVQDDHVMAKVPELERSTAGTTLLTYSAIGKMQNAKTNRGYSGLISVRL